MVDDTGSVGDIFSQGKGHLYDRYRHGSAVDRFIQGSAYLEYLVKLRK